MKRFLTIALAATTGLVIAGSASAATVQEGSYFKIQSTDAANVAAYSYGLAANGIQASRHNLGAMGFMYNTGGTSEICVFCHTPHHTLTATTAGHSYAPAPIWNRQSMASNFIGYGTTIGGSFMGNNSYGGVTLACLSCHDGVTTFDNIVNAPGSGLGANFVYGAGSKQGWTMYDETALQAGTQPGGSMPTDIANSDIRLNIGAGASGNNVTAGNVDMSNDHPMSVCFSDGITDAANGCNDTTKRASLRDRSTVIGDIDLSTGLTTTNGALANMSATKAAELIANLGQNRWAVRGFISGGAADGATGSGAARISDLLRLGKVECSSCHDPHFKNRSNVDFNDATPGGMGNSAPTDDMVDGLFLRRVGGNAGSGVCRTCHNK